MGFEPTRPLGHGDLNTASLPVPPQPRGHKSSGSFLQTDVLEHQLNAVAPVDPNGPTIPSVPISTGEDAHPTACSAEQVSDVR